MKYQVKVYDAEKLRPDGVPDKLEAWFDEPVIIYIDCLPVREHPDEAVILYLREPDEIYTYVDYAIANQSKFRYILTYDDRVLENCANAVKFEFGTTWIYGYDENARKFFGVSTIIGNKEKTDGHITRKKVWMRGGEMNHTVFFISSHDDTINTGLWPVLSPEPHKKVAAFGYHYHIAIENVRRNSYFTEKLIDCFQTRTVPIYWGCPNIGDYFNTDGMLIANTVDEIIEKANSLRPDDYERMLPAIEENYERSKQWCVPPNDRLIRKLKGLIT